MSQRVLSTEQAREAITQVQSTLSGGLRRLFHPNPAGRDLARAVEEENVAMWIQRPSVWPWLPLRPCS